MTSPLAQNLSITIVRGDDYKTADARQFEFVNEAGSWPDLTGATIKFTARHKTDPTSVITEFSATVINPNGANQQVDVELSEAETLGKTIGVYDYDVEATLASTRVITLVLSEMSVLEDQTI